MRQRARKRGRECGARTEEREPLCLLSQDPVSLFRFFPLFLPFGLFSPPTAQDETLCCFVPCIHRAHSFSLLRARVCVCVRARTRNCVCRNERERKTARERESVRNPVATRGPSRWRRINRCALHLAPPHPPATPSSRVLGCHPSATSTFARGRVLREPRYDLRGAQAIRERY